MNHPCTVSPFALCRKKYVHQLLPTEYNAMQGLLQNPQYAHWPICSIAHFARRNNIVTVGISTWYLFAKFLGFKRSLPDKFA